MENRLAIFHNLVSLVAMSEEDYEQMRERLMALNDKCIGDFINHSVGVKKKGKLKTLKHADCLRFFADEYLLNYESEDLLEGLESFPMFVGDWFIRKCMWSDSKAVSLNLEAFEAFLIYLEQTQKVSQERIDDLRERIGAHRDLYILRAKCYNDPEFELEDIMNEFGDWNDEILESLINPESQAPSLPRLPGRGKLSLHLLLSAKAAKFFKLKSPELVHMKEWSKSWDDPKHHWISNWRCEECFGMKGTKERVFMLTNERTRYSMLLRLGPGDIKGLFRDFHARLMREIEGQAVRHPSEIDLQISTLSGAARGLSTFQNNQMYDLDLMLERGDGEYLDDYDKRLNQTVTSINGAKYIFPSDEFARLCKEAPPFAQDDEGDNIIPFLN